MTPVNPAPVPLSELADKSGTLVDRGRIISSMIETIIERLLGPEVNGCSALPPPSEPTCGILNQTRNNLEQIYFQQETQIMKLHHLHELVAGYHWEQKLDKGESSRYQGPQASCVR